MAARKKYSDEQLTEAVATSFSTAEVLRKLGLKQAGGTQAHTIRRIKALGLDTSHFRRQGWNKGGSSSNRKDPSQILILLPDGSYKAKSYQLRRAMLEMGVPEVCNRCKLGTEWMGQVLTLEVDHIDTNWLDNRLGNLQFLCPNCHAQKTSEDYQARKSQGVVAQLATREV